jgi:hypothetical protein
MQLKKYGAVCIFLLSLTFLIGCVKNESHYYADNDHPGTAIFSNTGNNVFSCYINGQAWRTIDRKIGGFGSSTYEVGITKQNFDSLTDHLSINWFGYYLNNQYDYGTISLVLSVPKNFTMADFSALQGKRLIIDGVNSNFSAQVDNTINGAGSGSIYFNTALLYSNGVNRVITGRMSGLLEADFGSVLLTSGKFDHNLDGIPLFFQ